MKAETKAKWQRRIYNFVEEWPWFASGIAFGAALRALTGVAKVEKHSREIEATQRKLIQKHNQLCDVVNQHAYAGNELVKHVKDLERQNNLLLEKALEQTEGKTE